MSCIYRRTVLMIHRGTWIKILLMEKVITGEENTEYVNQMFTLIRSRQDCSVLICHYMPKKSQERCQEMLLKLLVKLYFSRESYLMQLIKNNATLVILAKDPVVFREGLKLLAEFFRNQTEGNVDDGKLPICIMKCRLRGQFLSITYF